MTLLNDTKSTNESAREILQAKVEALFQLKDQLPARDREIMFQGKYEMEMFLQKNLQCISDNG
eukprot:13478543-Ditylum_brightwellii.AAC.1